MVHTYREKCIIQTTPKMKTPPFLGFRKLISVQSLILKMNKDSPCNDWGINRENAVVVSFYSITSSLTCYFIVGLENMCVQRKVVQELRLG